MTRAINPTGSMLLDRSSAHPGSIDKSVFEKKSGSSSGSGARTGSQQAASQGTVNPNYLKECREDNPEPTAAQDQTKSVSLGACKITTPQDDLVIDQPFEMSVEVKSASGQPSGQVSFSLFCTIPDPAGGAPKCEDQSLSFSGKITNGIAKASGKLVSPKKPVPTGTKLQYHVVAEHPEAKEKSESPKVEVESGKPPKPLAVWSLGAVHFGFDSSFILPSAAAKIAEFKTQITQNPGAAVAVFGHADPVGEDDNNKGLSGRRAFAVWCLLAKDPTGWTQLASADKWDLRTTQTMLAHLKDKAASEPYYGGSIDGKTGPKTESAIKAFRADHSLGNGTTLDGKSREALYKAYMESVCEVTCKPEDFVGDPKDTKRQWACVGCSEFNPVLVFSKADDAKFRNASDKTERNAKNAPNRRATVFLFPPGAKGPGNVEFPCPQWSEGVSACRKQFFEDADKRRNPSDTERTWEKDKDTFACRFYAGMGENGTSDATMSDYCFRLLGFDLDPLPAATPCTVDCDGRALQLTTDENGYVTFQSKATTKNIQLSWHAKDEMGVIQLVERSGIVAVSPDEKPTFNRLGNLGFTDAELEDRIKAYQRDMEQEETGIESDIADEVKNWHDGGDHPKSTSGTKSMLAGGGTRRRGGGPLPGAPGGTAKPKRKWVFTSKKPVLFLDGCSPNDAQTILTALREISSDTLELQGFEIFSRGNGKTKPLGTELIRLQQHESSKAYITTDPSQSSTGRRNGNPSESLTKIWLGTDLKFYTQKSPSDTKSMVEQAPMYLVLAHELVHALHILTTGEDQANSDTNNYFDDTGKSCSEQVFRGEMRTVGLGSMNERISENTIRAEHQLNRRCAYQDKR